MATHSSVLAWRISWTEEPGRLQSMQLRRVRRDWATKYTHTHTWATKYTHTHTHTHTRMQPFIQARSLSFCFLKAVINPEMCVAIIFYGVFSLFFSSQEKKNYLTHDFWRTRENCGHVKSHHSSLQGSLIGSDIVATPSLISWSILPSPALHTHANTRWQFLDKLLYLLVKSCLVTKNTFYSCSNSHFWPLTDSSLVNMQIYGLETNTHQLCLQLSVGQRLFGDIIICDINMSILTCSWVLKIWGLEQGPQVLNEGVKAQKSKWFAQGCPRTRGSFCLHL